MLVYLIRHGQTDWNKNNLLQGRSDISLNEDGRRMAEIAAKGLADVGFCVIYSSPLKRAVETAEIIRGERDIPIMRDTRIIEMAFGGFEGCYYNKEKMKPDNEIYNFFFAPDKYVPAQAGESVADIRKRTEDFLMELANNTELEDKIVLVASHGAAISAMLACVKDLPDKDFWRGGVTGNCSVTILSAENGVYSVVRENMQFS